MINQESNFLNNPTDLFKLFNNPLWETVSLLHKHASYELIADIEHYHQPVYMT